MESRYYETIQETGHLQARFEPVISPARVFPAHWHEYVEILYIREGSLSAIVQASEYDLSAGDLMIINSGDLHMTRTGGSHYLILQISARQLRAYLPDFDRLRFTTVIHPSEVADSSPLFALFHQMEELFQTQLPYYELLFASRLYEFLYILCRDHSTITGSAITADNDRDRLRITRVMEWIRALSGKSDPRRGGFPARRLKRILLQTVQKIHRADVPRISERRPHHAPVQRPAHLRRYDHFPDGKTRTYQL